MTLDSDAIAKSKLGNRAKMCNRWRFMPGMLLTSGDRICSHRGKFDWFALNGGSKVYVAGGIPDFDDPATMGCLLALVREAWGDPYLVAIKERNAGWIIAIHLRDAMLCGQYIYGATEAEALVAALEAAP